VFRSTRLPSDWASVVQVPPGVLADAIEKKIVNLVHISMRLSVELNHRGAQTDFLFWGMLTIYELGYFPLRHVPITRVVSAAFARRRELIDIARSVLTDAVRGRRSALDSVAGWLMPTEF
jgi:hypothetical protein